MANVDPAAEAAAADRQQTNHHHHQQQQQQQYHPLRRHQQQQLQHQLQHRQDQQTQHQHNDNAEDEYNDDCGHSVAIAEITHHRQSPAATSSDRSRCCVKTTLQIALSTPGLVVLVVAYSLLGALIFPVLEAPTEPLLSTAVVLNSREECLKELWTITERLNVLYERNWTMLVHEQLRRFEGSIVAATRGGLIETSTADGGQPRWTFSEALLYSVTVITTIGHGNLTPRTSEGKVVTMLYALVGVPLMLMCLSSLGGFLAEALQCFYGRLCGGGSSSSSTGGINDNGNIDNGCNGDESDNRHHDGSASRKRKGNDNNTPTKAIHQIRHTDDNELNCNVCTRYDAVYSKETTFDSDRDDSCCLIRQSPAKTAASTSTPPPSRRDAAVALNNANANYSTLKHQPQQQQQQQQMLVCNNATLPRDGGKHNRNQMHQFQQQQQQQLQHQQQQQNATYFDSAAAASAANNPRSTNVYFTLNRMQVMTPMPPQPSAQQYPHSFRPATLVHFHPPILQQQYQQQQVPVPTTNVQHIPPPALFATQAPIVAATSDADASSLPLPPPPSYTVQLQQMSNSGDSNVGTGSSSVTHNYHSSQPSTTATLAASEAAAASLATTAPGGATTTTSTMSMSMQLPSNFANNEYRVMQQHQQPHPMSIPPPTPLPLPPSSSSSASASPMHHHHQHQLHHHHHHHALNQHQHHTATVHAGLGRSKFMPKPLPPEINSILMSDAGNGNSSSSSNGGNYDANSQVWMLHNNDETADAKTAMSSNAAPATTTAMTTTTSSTAASASLSSKHYGGTSSMAMSSLETLDDDDDDDPRNGCPHGTPSRIPLIRQRSTKDGHSMMMTTTKHETNMRNEDTTAEEDRIATAAALGSLAPDQLSIRSYNGQSAPQVPITVILIILIGYIAIGTAIFALWENWSLVDGAYFCFVTLSTIGFGDLMPTKTLFHGPDIQLFACCVYLVLGLVLVAMAFSLLETQLLWKCRRMAVRLKLAAD